MPEDAFVLNQCLWWVYQFFGVTVITANTAKERTECIICRVRMIYSTKYIFCVWLFIITLWWARVCVCHRHMTESLIEVSAYPYLLSVSADIISKPSVKNRYCSPYPYCAKHIDLSHIIKQCQYAMPRVDFFIDSPQPDPTKQSAPNCRVNNFYTVLYSLIRIYSLPLVFAKVGRKGHDLTVTNGTHKYGDYSPANSCPRICDVTNI